MTSTPTSSADEQARPYHIEADLWFAEAGADSRRVTTTRTAFTTWEAALGYAEELEAQDLSDWHFRVRERAGEPVLAKLDRTVWRSIPQTLTGAERFAASQLEMPEGQPAPEGSHGAGITGQSAEPEVDLDARLRKLLGELLGVEITFSETLAPERIDPDLLRTLKVEFNPWLEKTNRYNMACLRLTGFTSYVAAAGGFGHLRESGVARVMLVQILEEMLSAARDLEP